MGVQIPPTTTGVKSNADNEWRSNNADNNGRYRLAGGRVFRCSAIRSIVSFATLIPQRLTPQLHPLTLCFLYVELEENTISVLNDIFLAFLTVFSVSLDFSFASVLP